MAIEGPKPTGSIVIMNDQGIEGMVIPWLEEDDSGPALLKVPGSDLCYLPLFESEEALSDFMTRIGVSYSKIKRITSGSSIIECMPDNIKLAANPHFTAEGRVRWMQIMDSEMMAKHAN